MKDIFISHAWGYDAQDRDNHIRCNELRNKLEDIGFTTWFDEHDMKGNIDKSIMKGINNCTVVLVCLTEKYVEKINAGVNLHKINDNCFKEWNYALFKNKIIIPILMEKKMHRIWSVNGILQLYLHSVLYMDISEDNYETNDFTLLMKTLRNYGIKNKFYKNSQSSSNDSVYSPGRETPEIKEFVTKDVRQNFVRTITIPSPRKKINTIIRL